MAEELKVGVRVVVKEKNLVGLVKFAGTTLFAPGKWIGIELDEAKGKNNGVIQGKVYFQCRDNHGLMVRQNQVQVLQQQSVSRIPAPSHSNIPTPSSKRPSSGSKKSSPQGQGSSPKQPKNASRPQYQAGSPPLGEKRVAERDTHDIPSFAPIEAAVSTGGGGGDSGGGGMGGDGEAPLLSSDVTDLNQRVFILQTKRAEDKARIKELEKFKAHYIQMTEYKQRWSESQSELQQQLKAATKETREYQLAKERAEEEMRDLSDTVEMATLDKEMAEERCESLEIEVEALKEKVEELTIDLEIIKQEISEGGVEGAAVNAQYKQLEQQNSRLKEALVRLRDLSSQDKLEHQRVIKDLEKSSVEFNHIKEQKDKIAQELQEADAIIDELKEQVDVALGAEEMVEKLTDTNLELEEKIEALNETVADLEALRDLSEEQEELRMEVEHDLREELDLSLNSVRQMERKLEAAQETIVDQQQTIEKFREVVHNLTTDLTDLRSKGERAEGGGGGGGGGGDGSSQSQSPMMNINLQLKSAIKAQSRTIDFELRKLDALQASEHISLVNSFMPNSFLISGGDYDALLVLMMLPRMTFKVELLVDQLKQQHDLDNTLGSLSTITPSKADQATFVSILIYKLTTLNMLVDKANRILKECAVPLYRQMGGVRDDLQIHEKALDILIELLKKEQLDESVPLHGLDKAIFHFESLLDGRLRQEDGSVLGHSAHLLNQTLVMSSGCDVITLQLLRLRGLAPDNSEFVAQMKEMDSFNNDLRQCCRKVRRKVPPESSNRILLYVDDVAQSLSKTIRRQALITEAFKSLHLKASQRANSLTDGEKLTSGELEEFIRQVVASGTLQEVSSEVPSQQPKEMLRAILSLNTKSNEKFLSELSDGAYDSPRPKIKLEAPVVLRARNVKAELNDIEGLGFKLEERQQDILQLKKNLKLKAQEMSEANIKIGLLEKKVESIDSEIARQVAVERKETERMKEAKDNQERQFQQTVAILQGDIENLENDRQDLEKKLDQTARKGVLADIKLTSKIRTLGGQGSPYGASPYQSPASSPFVGRRGVGVSNTSEPMDAVQAAEPTEQSPLLLSRIESLNKALGCSINENFRLKTHIAKAQLNSLTPLRVPRHLLIRKKKTSSADPKGEKDEIGSNNGNQTDQEKSIHKRVATTIDEISEMCVSQVIPSSKMPCSQPPPGEGAYPPGEGVCPPRTGACPREQLSNKMARMFVMQRKVKELKDDVGKLLAGQYPGGVVTTPLASFNSPQFTKTLTELFHPSDLAARIRPSSSSSPPQTNEVRGSCRKILLSPAQFQTLHMAVVT